MIVEQPEAFKTWLTAVLKPMCDADPAALAKYVIALIKKDKADDELRKSMIGQLEVFLEEETEPFVNLVFQTLQSQEYIITPVIPNANPPNPNIVKKDKEVVNKDKVIVQPSELPNLNEQINGAASTKKEAETKREKELRESRKAEIDIKDKDDKTTRVPRIRRDRSASRDRVRSRSRSWDRSKRSRSRDKSRERERSPHRACVAEREKRDRPPRVWRNKSPPARSSRYERRRSRTPQSPAGGRTGRSRSPRSPRYPHRVGRYRNRSLDRSRSRSRSRSADKPRRDSVKDKERELSRPGTPTQDSNHGEADTRLNTAAQSVQSCVLPPNKRRCRDFDEKGYCMRGEMCPFDHGVDPVVLEDAALSRVLNYNPNGTPPEVPTNLAPPMLTAPGHPMIGPRGAIPSEYNPQAPFLRGFRGPRPLGPARLPTMGMFPPQPNMNRELIPVPVMDNKQNPYTPGYPPQGNFVPLENHDPFYHQKKNKFDYNRLGPRAPKNPANCSLELKKIPAGLNSITHLNNHFSKFGKITNIQVNYEGDTEAAIVTFSSHAEASAAYRSTEAVLNNRFIKVFWHNVNNDDVGTWNEQIKVSFRGSRNKFDFTKAIAGTLNKGESVCVLENKKSKNRQKNSKVDKIIKLGMNSMNSDVGKKILPTVLNEVTSINSIDARSDKFDDSEKLNEKKSEDGLKSHGMGIGYWEKHTKGIGAKLLFRMGFELGKGLGKNLQGISSPIKTVLKKDRKCLGSVNTEKHEAEMGIVPVERFHNTECSAFPMSNEQEVSAPFVLARKAKPSKAIFPLNKGNSSKAKKRKRKKKKPMDTTVEKFIPNLPKNMPVDSISKYKLVRNHHKSTELEDYGIRKSIVNPTLTERTFTETNSMYKFDNYSTFVFPEIRQMNSRYRLIRRPTKITDIGKQENVPPRPVKERLGMNQVVAPNTNKVLNLVQPRAEESNLVPPGSEAVVDAKNDALKSAAQNKEETKAQATAAIKKNQELLAVKEKLKKNQDEQRKEVMKIKQDLRKRKQELLEKQLSQQKILIEKMEKLPAGPQRDLIKETIKKTQESIEEIRKDIAHSAIAVKAAVPQKKTKEDAQKEMLDIELDLITKQQEGADTTEIQKKYFELKARTAMLRGRARGRRFNPVQRHLLSKNNLIDNSVVKSTTKIDRTSMHSSFNKPTTHSIDHRPTRILVSGYEIEEQDSVIAHFQQYGEIGEYVIDSALPSVTFNFKVRKDAEAALLKGKHFQDRTLSITWCTNAQHNSQISNSRTTRKVVMSESEEEQLIDQSLLDVDDDNVTGQDLPEEVLLQDDDEDDDEDRSWRR